MDSIRKSFSHELEELEVDLISLASIVSDVITRSFTAYIERDVKLAGEIEELDDMIDGMEMAIENRCLLMLARQQPMASDLRRIASILKVATEVERIADLATKIARMAKGLAKCPPLKPDIDLSPMAEKVFKMYLQAFLAFSGRNTDLAAAIIESDDEIDEYNHAFYRQLITAMRSDSNIAETGVEVITVTQSLERIADHVTNICERTIYMKTGRQPKDEYHGVPPDPTLPDAG